MNNILWEVFEKTGNIEAYLYVKEYEKIESEFSNLRENEVINDSNKHTGDSP